VAKFHPGRPIPSPGGMAPDAAKQEHLQQRNEATTPRALEVGTVAVMARWALEQEAAVFEFLVEQKQQMPPPEDAMPQQEHVPHELVWSCCGADHGSDGCTSRLYTVNAMHATVHSRWCQLVWSVRYRMGGGHTNSEICEQTNSELHKYFKTLRALSMRRFRRQVNNIFEQMNDKAQLDAPHLLAAGLKSNQAALSRCRLLMLQAEISISAEAGHAVTVTDELIQKWHENDIVDADSTHRILSKGRFDDEQGQWGFAKMYCMWQATGAANYLKSARECSVAASFGMTPEGVLTSQESKDYVSFYPAKKCLQLEAQLENCYGDIVRISMLVRTQPRQSHFLKQERRSQYAQRDKMLTTHGLLAKLDDTIGTLSNDSLHADAVPVAQWLKKTPDGSLLVVDGQVVPTTCGRRRLLYWANGVSACLTTHGTHLKDMKSFVDQVGVRIQGYDSQIAQLDGDTCSWSAGCRVLCRGSRRRWAHLRKLAVVSFHHAILETRLIKSGVHLVAPTLLIDSSSDSDPEDTDQEACEGM
jgi:hypothetical protein